MGDSSKNNFDYFNPAVGMPLSCASDSCISSSDNKNFEMEKDLYNLGQFDVKNVGVNDVLQLPSTSRKIDLNEPMITDIDGNDAGPNDDELSYVETIVKNKNFIYYSWMVPSTSYFHFVSGGASSYRISDESFETFKEGRFSFILRGNHSFDQELYMDNVGVRCMVKLNETE